VERKALVAVILAAGASTRMGRPKALLEWRGHTFLAHAVALVQRMRPARVVVVQGAVPLPGEAWAGAELVHHPGWARGPSTSLQAGLAALADEVDAAVVVHGVDRPHVLPATADALAAAWSTEPGAIWQPRHAGRSGHPVVWPADLVARLRALPEDASPRTVLYAPDVTDRRRYVDVADPAVLDNLDRPDDLDRLPP
jgi:CTP:molybdopterin cytidylyltransferase MocA